MSQNNDKANSISGKLAKLNLPKDFRSERSHKASFTSNEHSRATAQACLLINGGAATAVLAYLAKDKIDPALFNTLPWVLFGYTLGVLAGAFMLFCATQSLDHYNQFWLWSVSNPRSAEAQESYRQGGLWWNWYYVGFVLTLFFFIASNFAVAWSIHKAPPPQDVPALSTLEKATSQKLKPTKDGK